MSKMRLATIISMVGMTGLLIVSLPVNRTKADHCHPGQNQATSRSVPQTASRSPVRRRASSSPRQRRQMGIPHAKNTSDSTDNPTLEEVYSKDFPMAVLSIGEAVKAIESGDKRTELIELSKALDKLVTVHKALGVYIKPEYANNLRCPVMGSPIQPDNVDENLTREYNGRRVAFCCPGCPAQWDNLTDNQKQAKLPGAKS